MDARQYSQTQMQTCAHAFVNVRTLQLQLQQDLNMMLSFMEATDLIQGDNTVT